MPFRLKPCSIHSVLFFATVLCLIIIAGQNYGQGSSREHAALAPLQLGVKAVIAKSFARIHMANLINNGILPLVFVNEWDYDNIKVGDEFVIKYAADQIKGAAQGQIVNVTCVKIRGRNP